MQFSKLKTIERIAHECGRSVDEIRMAIGADHIEPTMISSRALYGEDTVKQIKATIQAFLSRDEK